MSQKHIAGIVLFGSLALILSSSQTLYSQQTPEYDNTVGLDFPRVGPGPGVPTLNVITTPDGFDNFDMGTDFAEPHASTNPRNAPWFFNAFNTNGTHHSENCLDWVTNNPSFPSAAGDPATAYDSLGNLYYMTMKSPITGTWVVKSANNGQSWSAAVSAVNGADKNWMAADQTMGPYANYIYATMTSSTSGQGNFARSTDLGGTFTQTFTAPSQSLPGMMVCVGPNVLGGNNISGGCVYVVTNSGSSTAATYTFYCSTNGGATFVAKDTAQFANYVGTFVGGRNSVQNMRTRPYPFIAADNSFGVYRGRLYLVYASNNPSGDGNKPDIFCRYSTDQGATWSSAVTINDDPSPTTHHQWHPSIWCDKETGRLYVKWLDTRNVPTSDSCEVYASYSDNGGVTWAANQRVSNAKMKIDCSTCGGGGTPRYQGDYDAVASNRYTAMLVWTDYRIGTFGSYSAYFPDFAMLVTPTTTTIGSTGSVDLKVKVPAVKLYSQSVTFNASVAPAGNFTFTFLPNNTISGTSFPDSLTLRVSTSNATAGSYTVTILGSGPNGTPVHRRTVAVTVDPALPIQLASFTACVVGPDQVRVDWTTLSEQNNYGFEVQKSPLRPDNYVTIPNSFVPGYGTTTEPHAYSFLDIQANNGIWFYRLKQIDLDGSVHFNEGVRVDVLTATSENLAQPTFALAHNYPNPFNPTTNISFSIPCHGFTILKVLDLLGREVALLANENLQQGSYQRTFDGTNLGGGVYYYQLKSGKYSEVKRLLLLK